MASCPAVQVESAQPFNGLDERQRDRVVEYHHLVSGVVNRIISRLPSHIDAGDLVNSGTLGLIDAVTRFSWGRQREAEEFRAYAECRIRGQIMDDLRLLDHLPRSARDRINRYKKTKEGLTIRLNRLPDDREMAFEMEMGMEDFYRLKAESEAGYQFVTANGENEVEEFERLIMRSFNHHNPQSTEARLHIGELHRVLSDEIDFLPSQQRIVVSLYYLEDLNLKEIGEILDVTESRVSQIHSEALARLAGRLKKRGYS